MTAFAQALGEGLAHGIGQGLGLIAVGLLAIAIYRRINRSFTG